LAASAVIGDECADDGGSANGGGADGDPCDGADT